MDHVRRSNIIVPANSPSIVEACSVSGADALTLSFPHRGVAAPLQHVETMITLAGKHGAEVFIEVMGVDLQREISELVRPGLRGIVLAGVETIAELQDADRLMADLELALGIDVGFLEIVLLVGSARGVWDVRALIRASDRIREIALDETSICRSYGVVPTLEVDPCTYARGRIVIEGIAAGVQPIGCPYSGAFLAIGDDHKDVIELAKTLKNLGFKGMLIASPTWSKSVNVGFTPTRQEVEYCATIRRVFAAAVESGKAAVGIDGKMIDVPVDEWARSVLEVAEACANRDQVMRK